MEAEMVLEAALEEGVLQPEAIRDLGRPLRYRSRLLWNIRRETG